MAWPNPFRATTASTRNCWNYRIDLGPDHWSSEKMEPMKHSWDTLADAALDRLNAISPPTSSSLPRKSVHSSDPTTLSSSTSGGARQETSSSPSSEASGKSAPAGPKRDLYQVLADNHSSDPVLSELWTQLNTVPDWVDWAAIERGQAVFYRYGGASINGLAFQSLLGGMGAARVVEVLSRTGGFSTKVAKHRLYETTQHVLQCTRDLASVQPGGEGWASSIRVRLLHAAVRKRILKLAESRPSYYSVEQYGVPINDLDCIGTLASFSATLVWVALPRQGIWMRAQETEDYIALWRYVGYVLGTPVDCFATPARARAVMESLMLHEIRPSETSKALSRNVIEALSGVPPVYASRNFLEANSRWLLGNELCDALGLGRPPLYYWLLVVGQCLFFMGLCYTYRTFDRLDRYKVGAVKTAMWKVIVESDSGLGGKKTDFDFKYLPENEKRTTYEEARRSGIIVPRGVHENRNLMLVGLLALVLAATTTVGVKVTGAGVRMMTAC